MVFASQTTSSKCLTTVFPFILTAVLSSLFSVAHCIYGPSAFEVTTLWRYTNNFIIIIIIYPR